MKKMFLLLLVCIVLLSSFLSGCSKDETSKNSSDAIVLKVCNWEEYIDLGSWEDDEIIELDNGASIFGENSMIEDFEEWYYDTYGKKVVVEYSTFGTNEELYNQLTLGDKFDLVCPSDYLIMKLMAEGRLLPYSSEFLDASYENNYYARGVSDYISEVFRTNKINGESWYKYAAGYMWGTTGIVYNPKYVTADEASTWSILENSKFHKQITVKDNVRDTYFAGLGIYKKALLSSSKFTESDDYNANLQVEMNDTSYETIANVEEILKRVRENVYSFETDSGKADMVTEKIIANYQWSGDAVYAMEQAEEDGLYLQYSIPKEGTNLWFDGWVMLKDSVKQGSEKQHAAEAFVNFLSRPDNAVRNMYYIGYTSVISGGDDDTIFEYMNWYYGAEYDAEDTEDYDVSYFFGPERYITAESDQLSRELYAQYPTEDILDRCAVMGYFDAKTNERINQMWINIRCIDIESPVLRILLLCAIGLLLVGVLIFTFVVPKTKFTGKKRERKRDGARF